MISRIVLLLYEARVITFTGFPEDNIVIVISSILRTFFMAVCLIGLGSIYTERSLATRYLADYEQRKRTYISYCLGAKLFVLSLISGVVFTFEWIAWYLLAFLSFIVTVISFILLARLYAVNKRRQEKLHKDHRTARLGYTLSVRFQLDENIRSFEIMKTAVYNLGIQNIVSFVLFALFNTSYIRDISDGLVAYFLEQIFNIIIACNGPGIIVATLFSNEALIRTCYEHKYLRVWVFWWTPPIEKMTLEDETNVYFTKLHMQWDQQLNESARAC